MTNKWNIKFCIAFVQFLALSVVASYGQVPDLCTMHSGCNIINLPKPFSEIDSESQIMIAMSLNGEQFSLGVPIADTTSSYLQQVASVLAGFKHLASAEEFEDDVMFENYQCIKRVWLSYLYKVFDEEYGDTEISPKKIIMFTRNHLSYMSGEKKFPKWELCKLMQGPNFNWAVASNHSYAPVSFALELEYLMEYGLAGLKSIRDVADIVSPDGKAGLLSIESEYNDDYGQSIILLEGDDGIYCNMWFIDKQGYIQSNHYSSVTMEYDDKYGTVYKFSWDIDDYTVNPVPERCFYLKNGRIEEQES